MNNNTCCSFITSIFKVHLHLKLPSFEQKKWSKDVFHWVTANILLVLLEVKCLSQQFLGSTKVI